MARRKTGRSKGSRNNGYWFRKGRGWYVTEGRSAVPLCDDKGNHIKSAEDEEGAKEAYARRVLQIGQPSKQAGLTVMDACRLYLDHVQSSGSPETYRLRAGFLFDLCTGFPARFRESKTQPAAKDRIHPGLGARSVMELTRLDVERWVKAHPRWKSSRAALQAVRRALNYCREAGLIESSPLRGLKVPKVGKRETYMAPEVEEAVYQHARPALALAVRVGIRTGARPDIEFASLEARHVEETPRGQRWRFPADKSKGREKERTIYVPEEIAGIVRKQMKKHRNGPVFRNESGGPWTLDALESAFRRLKRRLHKMGIVPEEPFVPYTCRHTYAKRMLGGYWGEPVTLEVLAGLMGNTPKICWEHYAKWSQQYTDPFWNAIGSADRNGGRVTSAAGVGA